MNGLHATYRVQLTPGFGFDQLAAIAPYLSQLGVSHVYLSPILQAAPGSTYGYDVDDHEQVSTELGGIDSYQRMSGALAEHGLHQVLDIVPNHMAIGSEHSRWWWDVLENGPSSLYADAFDVDWDPSEESLRNRVLVPILADSYGSMLEAGRIRLERTDADFVVVYEDTRLPVAPKTLDTIMLEAAKSSGSSTLTFLADAYAALPAATRTDWAARVRRHRDKDELRRILATALDDEGVRVAVDAAVAAAGEVDALDALLQRQNYRLAHWRTAQSELDYRRFFDVTTLVGLRMDRPWVFEQTHRLILEIVGDGHTVDGLRVDHPDGLRDPEAYLRQLSTRAPGCWIVVEKILARDETLPAWPVAGTTGYDALDRIQGVLTAATGEDALSEVYRDSTGATELFTEVAETSTRHAIANLLRPDLERLVNQFRVVCDRDRRWRDFARTQLRRTLTETLVGMPVYRTYGAPGYELREVDRAVIATAVEWARKRCDPSDEPVLDALFEILRRNDTHPDAEELAARFQQFSGAVRAKGIEDTAFYRYNRFVAANEVGADPDAIAIEPADLHARNARTSKEWPRTMVTTWTHDTKRSEDVRARLLVLSELPHEWAEVIRRWLVANEKYRHDGMPDRNTEYLLYQTIVGAHPISAERLGEFMVKAVREAKVHTSWLEVDVAYERQLRHFVESLCGNQSFIGSLNDLVDRIEPHAIANSLAQAALKLGLPGVPDIYQGNEVRTFSLADPDNRRPVDFDTLRDRLAAVSNISNRHSPALSKLWVTRQGLRLRAERSEAFLGESATYEPIEATGLHSANVLGFVRGGQVAILVTLFSTQVADGWGDTEVQLPAGSWRDVLTARSHGRRVRAVDLLADLPVALLAREATP
ncbi:MAG TPA: malto-oligosyltrehalose synthase [Acidimicrobiales bacterium]|nr:malto-oligosyltrehalose synthase [Acidimicrobiales bacterium]